MLIHLALSFFWSWAFWKLQSSLQPLIDQLSSCAKCSHLLSHKPSKTAHSLHLAQSLTHLRDLQLISWNSIIFDLIDDITLWTSVYSNLFSSSVSKIMQLSSRKLMTGVFHLGDLRKFIIMSKNQSYMFKGLTYLIWLLVLAIFFLRGTHICLNFNIIVLNT